MYKTTLGMRVLVRGGALDVSREKGAHGFAIDGENEKAVCPGHGQPRTEPNDMENPGWTHVRSVVDKVGEVKNMRSKDTYSKFEKVRIISARALQISQGSPVLVEMPKSVFDPTEIANLEWDAEVVPIDIKGKK